MNAISPRRSAVGPLRFAVQRGILRLPRITSKRSTTMTIDLQAPIMRLKLADEETEIDLAALQGLWSVEQYLRLTNQTTRLIEYTDGVIEVLPIPTKYHQAISKLLFLALLSVVERIGGDVFYAPLRVQVRPGKFREPDLLLVIDKD